MIAVNLYSDRMSAVEPVRIADVSAVASSPLYREAARKLGLSLVQYYELRAQLADGSVSFGPIPTHIDEMAGSLHGHAYVLHDVVVPAHTLGWRIRITGAVVYVPQRCGNLSMNRTRVVASLPRQSRRVRAATVYVPPPIPVTFAGPVAVGPIPVDSAPVPIVTNAPPPAAPPASTRSAGGFFAPLWPILTSLVSGGGSGGGGTIIPPCSAGSNSMGVCR